MRITLNGVAAISLSIAACVACSQKVETAKSAEPAKPAGVSITAVGCPELGPAPNCVSIKSKGKSYDLAGANPAVDLSRGVGISVYGTAGTETTACGIKMTDIKVEYLGIQCAAPAPTTEGAPPAAG